jgi:vitamin B12 transporter
MSHEYRLRASVAARAFDRISIRTVAFSTLFAGVASFMSSKPAQAQANDTTTLSTVVISATKTPVDRASLSQSVTVLTGAQLRTQGITRVADALRTVPGASLVENGAVGSVTSLFLRGGESRYTKVLIDGVAVNSPGGYFDFSHLTTDNVERIEIVRGPASVVYGADAVSGIVRIFTRQGRGPLSVNAEGRAGTYGTRDASLDLHGTSGSTRYSLGAGGHRTEGILPFNNGYYNGTLSGSLGIAPSPGMDALVTSRYTTAEYHYPTDYTGAPVDSNAYRVQHRLTVGADLNGRIAKSIKGRIVAGTNQVSDLSEDIAIPFGSSAQVHSASLSRNRRSSGEAGLLFQLPSATLNIGAEYLKESERSTNSEGPVGGKATPTSRFDADRDNKAVYAELNGSAGKASYTLASRRDDNSDYDAFTTYRVGSSIPLSATTRVRGSLSTAFNAPAFNQLRPTLYTTGSPNLDPERSRSWEVAAEQTFVNGAARASLSYFNQRFTDLIQYVSGGPPTYLGSYANLTSAESNGIEAELSIVPRAEWSVVSSYTHARPKVRRVSADYAGDLHPGQALLRRPTHSANVTGSWARAHEGSVSVSAGFVGKRPDLDFTQFPSPVVTLPSRWKIDVSGAKSMLGESYGYGSLSLTIRVDNALNRKYEDVLNFPAPRRTILIGARYGAGL